MSAPWWDDDYKTRDRFGPEYRCYVSNLPYSITESSLKDAFASYGAVGSEIVYDRETGLSRGFGFVNFDDEKSMNDAIQGMNDQQIGGRTISVSRANQRSSRWRYRASYSRSRYGRHLGSRLVQDCSERVIISVIVP